MNAKEEFLRLILNKEILCAQINYQDCYKDDLKPRNDNLPVNYTEQQLKDFIESLDYDYDSGYGGQELFGTVWFKDGTWADRGEYDGSEWWNYNKCPEIPKDIQ